MTNINNHYQRLGGPFMLFVRPVDTVSLALEVCDGYREQEGALIDCVPGCFAHFRPDAEQDYDEGRTPNRYENSILSWVALLPGSRQLDIPSDGSGAKPDWVQLHVNGSFFHNVEGTVVPCWVVLTHPQEAIWHLAVLFTSQGAAIDYLSKLLNPN